LKLKIDISKKLLLRLALFVVVVAAALVVDAYFGKNPDELEKIQAESQKQTSEPGRVYLLAQNASLTLKVSVQKSPTRNLKVQLHDKFLRKYHQLRNYQVFNAEVKAHAAPLIQSYHYLVFQNYFFTNPDEDSLA